jgi:hypothetical protein
MIQNPNILPERFSFASLLFKTNPRLASRSFFSTSRSRTCQIRVRETFLHSTSLVFPRFYRTQKPAASLPAHASRPFTRTRNGAICYIVNAFFFVRLSQRVAGLIGLDRYEHVTFYLQHG